VAYLWAYTVALWLLLRIAPRVMERAGARLDALLASGPAVLLLPALWLAVARLLLAGRFGSTHALVDDWYNHAQYFPVFLLGFLVARGEATWAAVERARWPALWLWLGSWGVIACYFRIYAEADPPQALRPAVRGLWGLDQWCAIVAILGFARRLAPGDSPALRYLSQAVFPVYILHQTIIVVLAWHLRPLALPPPLEGLLLVALTLVLAFAGYELVRRVPLLRPLFGLRPRDGVEAPARDARLAGTGMRR
jgi:hypothetical protein